MSKRCIIVASALEDACAVECAAGDFVVAADAGYLCCNKHGIIPDLVVGDFDSMRIEELDGAACEHVQLPCAKDDTDTLAAIRAGLEQGCCEFHIYGGISTDMAHSFANFQCLNFLEEHNAHGFLHTEGQVAQLVYAGSELQFEDEINKRLSIFSLGQRACKVSLRGTKWTLDNATLSEAFPVGVSNVIIEKSAKLSVHEGKLLCILG